MSDVSEIILKSKDNGLDGFGGNCALTAVAINRVLFEGKGRFIGIFNEAFLEKGRCVGHVCVEVDGTLWDGDGFPKAADDVDGFGVLSVDDEHYKSVAESHGMTWSEGLAEKAVFVEFDDENELMSYFNFDKLDDFIELLSTARDDVRSSISFKK